MPMMIGGGGGSWREHAPRIDEAVRASEEADTSAPSNPWGIKDEVWNSVHQHENLDLINRTNTQIGRRNVVADRIQGDITRSGGVVQNRTVGDLIQDTVASGNTIGMQQALVDAGYIDWDDITPGVMDERTADWVANIGGWAASNNMGFWEVMNSRRAAGMTPSRGGRGGRRGGGGGGGARIIFENPDELKSLLRETATALAGSTEGLTDEMLDEAIANRNAAVQAAATGTTQVASPQTFAEQYVTETLGDQVTSEKWANVIRGIRGFVGAGFGG